MLNHHDCLGCMPYCTVSCTSVSIVPAFDEVLYIHQYMYQYMRFHLLIDVYRNP